MDNASSMAIRNCQMKYSIYNATVDAMVDGLVCDIPVNEGTVLTQSLTNPGEVTYTPNITGASNLVLGVSQSPCIVSGGLVLSASSGQFVVSVQPSPALGNALTPSNIFGTAVGSAQPGVVNTFAVVIGIPPPNPSNLVLASYKK